MRIDLLFSIQYDVAHFSVFSLVEILIIQDEDFKTKVFSWYPIQIILRIQGTISAMQHREKL